MANYTTFRRIDHVVVDEYGIDPLGSSVFDVIAEVESYTLHEVSQHEQGNAPLLSLNVYNDEDLWWIILVYNAIFDAETELVAGKVIKIPTFPEINSTLAKLRTLKQDTGVTRI